MLHNTEPQTQLASFDPQANGKKTQQQPHNLTVYITQMSDTSLSLSIPYYLCVCLWFFFRRLVALHQYSHL